LTDFVFAIPGDLGLPTGGYIYDRRVIEECRRAGGNAVHLALPDGFPFPSAEVFARSGTLLHALPAGQPVLIDGLALGALPAEMLRGLRRPLAALVHHPLALETGLSAAQQTELFASEHAALAEVSAVIVTSPMTARILAQDYAVGSEKLVVALPGTDPAARATGTSGGPRILAVGSVIPRKAYGVLVEALHGLRAHDWSCHIVGAIDRDTDAALALRALIEAHGLADRIILTGAMTSQALEGEFAAADLFVSTSLYEGYGMALTEAIARGLPVVAAKAGAIPETLPAGTALLVPPGDAAAVAAAIGQVLDQPQLRRAMAEKAWAHAQTLPRWSQTADIIATTMRGISR
jgi:glycosyltransferase involved in cell wall biosynthesis